MPYIYGEKYDDRKSFYTNDNVECIRPDNGV